MKKALKYRVNIKIRQGQNCIKLEVYDQVGVQLKEIKRWRTILKFGQIPKLKP
jgi:hypothetical protein